jgi:hypothetical protein
MSENKENSDDDIETSRVCSECEGRKERIEDEGQVFFHCACEGSFYGGCCEGCESCTPMDFKLAEDLGTSMEELRERRFKLRQENKSLCYECYNIFNNDEITSVGGYCAKTAVATYRDLCSTCSLNNKE